jgi:hypothetical protein
MCDELVTAFKRVYLTKLLFLPLSSLIIGFVPACFITLALFENKPNSNSDAKALLFGSAIWLISSGALGATFYFKWWRRALFQGFDSQRKAEAHPILLSTNLLGTTGYTRSLDAVWVVEKVHLTKSPPGVGFRNPSSTLKADGEGGTRIGLPHPVTHVMPRRIIGESIAKCFGAVTLEDGSIYQASRYIDFCLSDKKQKGMWGHHLFGL